MELDDQTALKFQEDLLNKIYETGSNGVVIDLTSVDMIDSFIAKVLGDVITMSKLMGAKVVLTGIQPAVAVTLIELGISLDEIRDGARSRKGARDTEAGIGGINMEDQSCVKILTEWDIVAARQLGAKCCKRTGFWHSGPSKNYDGHFRVSSKHLFICWKRTRFV